MGLNDDGRRMTDERQKLSGRRQMTEERQKAEVSKAEVEQTTETGTSRSDSIPAWPLNGTGDRRASFVGSRNLAPNKVLEYEQFLQQPKI